MEDTGYQTGMKHALIQTAAEGCYLLPQPQQLEDVQLHVDPVHLHLSLTHEHRGRGKRAEDERVARL